jgi:hypothetical protein
VPLEEIEAVPPILSLLCRELNERRYPQPPGTFGSPLAEIVFNEHKTNVETILETFYERCLAGRPEAVRVFIEEGLVSPSGIRLQNDERSIVDVFANGVGPYAAGYGARDAAIDCLRELVNERLLSPVSGGETSRYELTHDLLCRVVYKSRTARQERIEKEQLERRAEEERRAKEEAESREKAERELRRIQERLAAENAKYAKEQQESASKLRRLAWMLALVALAAAAAAVFGFWQKRQAEKQTELALEAEHKIAVASSRANVSLAQYLLEDGKHMLALAHLAQALRLDPRNERAVALTATMLSESNWAIPVAGPIRHDEAVFSAQFNADGQRVVTASLDKRARVWDAATGKELGEPMRHGDAVRSAQFSPDGQRVVTTSWDKTARVWDAATGKAITQPLRHGDAVNSAQFSPDGQQVVTASWDKTAQVWDVPRIGNQDTSDDVLLLADLAECACGSVLQPSGQVEILKLFPPEQVRPTQEKVAAKFERQSSGLTPVERLLKWSVADPRRRTISPFSKLTVPNGLRTGSRRAHLRAFGRQSRWTRRMLGLIARFGLALAKLAVAETTDSDEVRRARAEADYQTQRAVKLASNNDEVEKLRAGVVKLLDLPSE